eukprot:CAMPEP_0171304054 /NCGR_PEP_ID=MMETSP0816-20121228/13714_1 /TAXON_ID=420281 /ORGANISM="Proboscia inermis, Strain CCAP1064/1" /LENGTH=40 /DNA_ID= /DNA_START= /DNA_END= /DNA_ORIENTATION=
MVLPITARYLVDDDKGNGNGGGHGCGNSQNNSGDQAPGSE